MTLSKNAAGQFHCKIERPDQGSYLYFNEFAAGFNEPAVLDPTSVRAYVSSPHQDINEDSEGEQSHSKSVSFDRM